MKIDVEGFEPSVLKGAQGLLSKRNVWFISAGEGGGSRFGRLDLTELPCSCCGGWLWLVFLPKTPRNTFDDNQHSLLSPPEANIDIIGNKGQAEFLK
jgi:hypothetical protein